jgi:hypothetical protein
MGYGYRLSLAMCIPSNANMSSPEVPGKIFWAYDGCLHHTPWPSQLNSYAADLLGGTVYVSNLDHRLKYLYLYLGCEVFSASDHNPSHWTVSVMVWLVFDVVEKKDEINTGIFADAYQGLALCRCQTLIRGLNTFTFTYDLRYFKPLIIIQVTALTLLWYDLCLIRYRKRTKKIQASLLMHIKVWHCIGVKPWS